ncbi:MAG: hypothetical protein M1822_001307 [Bathelium mastoideum]|nr:MAG: hypothetical protein M1822_001307 [Bathelium mastoideum]
MAPFKNIIDKFKREDGAKKAKDSMTSDSFTTAPEGKLFPKTDPTVDGEECLHDCESCTIKLPNKWKIDDDAKLYGEIKGWQTHLIVATGKTDWVRDVADEKGSVMEAVEKSKVQPNNGKLMLSASNIPMHSEHGSSSTCILLPSFTIIDNVTPSSVPTLIDSCVNAGPTNTTPLLTTHPASAATNTSSDENPPTLSNGTPSSSSALSAAGLTTRPCPHRYLILLCSHRTRDARCGQSAPLLRREFERHLRPLGLYRDLDDERPGGVGIYFISHVGGHKFSANCMVYRRGDAAGAAPAAAGEDGGRSMEAAQCMWLARVRPEDCENIVRYTILQGKVVKPESQLRGGFDRARQLVSW